MGSIVKGSLGAFAMHLLGFAISFGITYLSTNAYDDASDLAKRLPDGSAIPEVDVLLSLGDVRAVMFNWLLVIFLIGLICAILFLVRSAGAKAGGEAQRSALTPLWTILLFLDFALSIGLWWLNIASPEAAYAMIAGNYVFILSSSFGLLLLTYYLSTALLVKRLFVPSVPFASLIRGVA